MKKYTSPPFILVDGSSYLHRAFHALPPLTTSKGQPTGAVYGVVNMLRRLIKDYQPSHIAIVFDAKGKNFRHDLYPQYKANRPPMPDELCAQVQPLYDIIRALGLPLIILPGVEADDIIGTLAKQASKTGVETLISSGDKDLAQLVGPKVTLIDTMTNKVLDENGVLKKFGVPSSRILDYLSLVGDVTDNIPGVSKVGPKTAAKWIEQFGSLEGVIEHASEIKGQVGENLRQHLKQLTISRQLIELKQDLKLYVTPRTLQIQKPDTEKLIQLFKKLEFKSWLRELIGAASHEEKTANYQTILTEKAFENWLSKLEKINMFSLDTETTSLDPMEAELVGLSFSVKAGEASYLPLKHNYKNVPVQLDFATVLKKLKPILENKKIKKIGHNLKYDKAVLARCDIELEGIAYDTLLESYVLDSNVVRQDLDSLALKHLQYKKISYEDVAGKGAKQLKFNQIPIEKAALYAAEDADIALRLHEYFYPQIESEKKLNIVFSDIEMPLLPVLSRMERHGVLVDANFLKRLSKKFGARISKLENQIFKETGASFNLNSPIQLQEILYQKLGLPILQKTPSGQPSTAESVLMELSEDYTVPKLILRYRSLNKLKSTYTDALVTQINAKTKRIHTSYRQAVTATGRLSSSEPNLQNIPIRTEEGRQIRRAFIAPKGYKILAADYSQVELRIMAHLSNDAGLKRDFKAGVDIHQATAAKIFNVKADKVTSDQRRRAKAINFGLMYGMSSFGLSKRLGIEKSDAQIYIDAYFSQYSGIKFYMEQSKALAREKGYVETLFGRRLYTPDIKSTNQQRRSAAERIAINAPLQGTAADIIKKVMIALDNWLTKEKPNAAMLMQVHDELVFEVAEKELKKISESVRHFMENTVSLSVPLIVDIGIGDNWEEAH